MTVSTRIGAFLVVATFVAGCSFGGSGDDDGEAKGSTASDATASSEAETTTTTAPEFPPFAPLEGELVSTQPSGFEVRKLPEGATPPQFVIVSFDGGGWHEKWEFWRGVQEEVPYKFTAFLSGTYMLSDQTKDQYTGPGHDPGASSISWATAEDVPILIDDLNEALRRGDEIGTHFNGHFCSGNEPAANDWDTDDWNSELDQFFSFVENVGPNNGIEVDSDLDGSLIKGARTPCLEGDPALYYPAYQAHGLVYDSSPAETGISWPLKNPDYGIWNIAMATFPMAGGGRPLITMDYNFYVRQRNASSAGVTPEQSAADREQVVQTYRDMYNASLASTRAPLILGNHFNEWNNNAYSDAIAEFVRETCGKPETYCVPFRDLVAWMEAQDPATMERLQGLPAVASATPPELPADAFGAPAPATGGSTTTATTEG